MSWFRELSGARRAAVVAVVLVVVMVIGTVLAAGGGKGSSGPAPAAEADTASTPSDASDGPGPTAASGGVAVGFERTEAGALAAATSFASGPQIWLYLSEEDTATSVSAIVMPDAREEIVADVVQETGLLRDELSESSGTVWFVVTPLANRLEDFAEDRAVVRVWTVRVLSAEGVAVPQSGWQTVTFTLRWHDGDWKVAATTTADGPVPQLESGLQPWTAGYLAGELEGFSRVGTAP